MARPRQDEKTKIHCPPFRVLVVDDNPADLELACINLSKAWPFERVLYQAISNSLRLLGFAMSSASMQSFPMRPQV